MKATIWTMNKGKLTGRSIGSIIRREYGRTAYTRGGYPNSPYKASILNSNGYIEDLITDTEGPWETYMTSPLYDARNGILFESQEEKEAFEKAVAEDIAEGEAEADRLLEQAMEKEYRKELALKKANEDAELNF